MANRQPPIKAAVGLGHWHPRTEQAQEHRVPPPSSEHARQPAAGLQAQRAAEHFHPRFPGPGQPLQGERRLWAVTANYRRCVEAEAPSRYEETLALPGGRRQWETILAAVKDETGRVVRILASARDLPEKRHAEAERDRLFDLSLDPMGRYA